MERRFFLKALVLKAFYVLSIFFLGLPIFSFMTFRKVLKKTIVFHAQEQEAAVNFKEGVYLVRKQGEIYALSARCTHLGCTVNHDALAERFRCPCHGSVFDLSGKWLSGPAKKDLKRISLTKKDNNDIIVSFTL